VHGGGQEEHFIFSGIGLADTLPAALVYERAVAMGKGVVLPL
jgi:hypothetical protein